MVSASAERSSGSSLFTYGKGAVVGAEGDTGREWQGKAWQLQPGVQWGRRDVVKA